MSAIAQDIAPAQQHLRLRVRGRVQGVGFRPTVWRLARERRLSGQVRNDSEGVLIELHGPAAALAGFADALRAACPPLARIDAIEQVHWPDPPAAPPEFTIAPSRGNEARTAIAADAATCATCLEEILDPAARRHGHAFANCTHCGPRLSIIERIPYDRSGTSMAAFSPCDDCAREYRDPADRRFHAQPIACPACGPRLWLSDPQGTEIPADDPFAVAAQRLQQGDILAIKGIGGFQLACDAGNAEAIARLRRRKQRPHKPLALMARDLRQARRLVHIDPVAAQHLESPVAPILLLPRSDADLPEALAPGLDRLGLMLPNSPLHHLLLRRLNGPIVLTSGNRSGDPQCTGNRQAIEHLGQIADAFLMHDRAIVNRVDDSVGQIVRIGNHSRPQWLRRARGLAPDPLPLPPGFEQAPSILACGGEMKNSFCLLRDGEAIPSQYIGELQQAAAWADFQRQLARYERLWRFVPQAIAIDRHPQYLPSQYGRERAETGRLPLFAIQHHHAHIAACLADNGYPIDGDAVIGIALDGLGLGDDGSLWGGEVLIADYRRYRRAAHLVPVPLPGGSRAMHEPWRNAWSQLHRAGLIPGQPERSALAIFRLLAGKPLHSLESMVEQGINSPLSSSCGRLFDAVAATLGLRMEHISYEGQAALELEQAIGDPALDMNEAYPFAIGPAPVRVIDPAPMWRQLLADLEAGSEPGRISARFHAGLCQALMEVCMLLRREQPHLHCVALSGGVLQNRHLLEALAAGLTASGFRVLTHDQLPANDGGIAVGQAVIAAARLLEPREENPSCV